jgi:hypothetical protein
MKTRLASSMLAAAALTAAAGAQTVEFRIVEEALSGDASTVIAAPPSQGTTLGVSNLTGNYAVQARVTAGPGGVALGGFDFDIVILNEADANGQLVKMRISNPDGSYFTGSPALNAAVGTGGLARTYTYLAGINAAFNGQINTSLGTFSNNPAQQEIGLITASASGSALLGVPNMDPSGEGNVGTWSGYGLGATPLGGATASIDPTLGPTYFAQGQFIDIYRFRYTISDTTGRTLNITLDHASAQVFSNFLFNNGSWGPQAATVDAGSVIVTPLVVTVGVPGACCDLGSGGCTLVLESLCTFGTFSAGACAPNPCPEPQGQCCDMNGCTTTTLADCPQGNTWTLTCCNVASGACTTTTQPGCATGNAWMVATTCTPNPCPAPPQGSCCVIATGACSETAQIDCDSGSTWTLAGMCTPNTCVQPLGTCCNGNACTNTTQAACAVGNVWTLGAVCSAGVCPGTCCNVSTGTCSIQVASTCGLATHTWAAGGMCTPNPCEQPGDCCDPATGNCQRLIASRCTGSSTWMMSSTCSPNPCPQPPGACCDPIGLTCTSTTQAGCASGSNWHAGLDCMTVVCPPAGTCCDSTNGACSLQIQDSCGTNNTWTTGGSCTPNPCPSPSACCNIFTGACTLSVAAATVAYSYTYTKGLGGYARSDLGGTVERINARFEPISKRLVFDVQLSGAASGDPLTTAGFWLVLDRGPNPKAHPGELAIFYFDAQTLGSPLMTVYTYNGVDAGTSWSDGDPFALNDQPGDLIKGVYETSYINAIVAEDITVSGQPRRHMMFDIDASDIVAHVPQYLPVGGGAWFGTGFDLALGLWFHPVQSFAATYEANSGGARGGLASLTTGAEGWLDGTNRPTTDNDPCPSGSVISTQSACTPSNPCAPQRACCNATSGMCVVVYPLDDCPAGFVFASPAASSCSPSPCPSLARQPSGTCCNTLTGMCCVIPLSGCNPTAFAWLEGGTCATSGCPALQGACCNFITGGCTVLAQAACGTAAHDWSAGGACSSGECAAPGNLPPPRPRPGPPLDADALHHGLHVGAGGGVLAQSVLADRGVLQHPRGNLLRGGPIGVPTRRARLDAGVVHAESLCRPGRVLRCRDAGVHAAHAGALHERERLGRGWGGGVLTESLRAARGVLQRARRNLPVDPASGVRTGRARLVGGCDMLPGHLRRNGRVLRPRERGVPATHPSAVHGRRGGRRGVRLGDAAGLLAQPVRHASGGVLRCDSGDLRGRGAVRVRHQGARLGRRRLMLRRVRRPRRVLRRIVGPVPHADAGSLHGR